jgi:hypothetical protein
MNVKKLTGYILMIPLFGFLLMIGIIFLTSLPEIFSYRETQMVLGVTIFMLFLIFILSSYLMGKALIREKSIFYYFKDSKYRND